jgi:hypothetical protein
LLDILPNLSFGKNLKPSHVTEHVRRVLIREEKRMYRRFLLVPLIVIFT